MAHGLDGFFLIFLIFFFDKIKIRENLFNPSNLCAIKSRKNPSNPCAIYIKTPSMRFNKTLAKRSFDSLVQPAMWGETMTFSYP